MTKRIISGLSDNSQGTEEEITYTLDVSNFPSSPENANAVTVKIYSYGSSGYSDVTSAVTQGSVSVAGDTITLPQIQSLTAGIKYRVEVKWTGADGDVYEVYGELEAER